MITENSKVVYSDDYKNQFTSDTDLNEMHTVQQTEDLFDNGVIIVATLENESKVNVNYLKESE